MSETPATKRQSRLLAPVFATLVALAAGGYTLFAAAPAIHDLTDPCRAWHTANAPPPDAACPVRTATSEGKADVAMRLIALQGLALVALALAATGAWQKDRRMVGACTAILFVNAGVLLVAKELVLFGVETAAAFALGFVATLVPVTEP